MRAGVIRNPLSHAYLKGWRGAEVPAGVLLAEPTSPEALAAELKAFAAERVELIVIDGGDGTVREVITALPAAYGEEAPLLALAPTGKTNILAFDIGVPRGWPIAAALEAAARPDPIVKIRAPMQVRRKDKDAPPLSGFVFGAAGFVRGKLMAGDLHKRAGVFQNTAVGLTLAGAVAETLRAGGKGSWREGERLSLSIDGGPVRQGPRLVTMATTLERLPFAMRPFGPARPGLKVLDVDAPPRRLMTTLPALLWGSDDGRLAELGYRRGGAERLTLGLEGPFVLDGEVYPGGTLVISPGPPLRFLTP